ncbi:hypothetical protein GCM10009715_40960 [Paeniglutamicibacter psychrophenolicus]|uniref:EthD family reductase n=1 Tax=Paeniglutamicibacter psychrophenolicus TaxID=257454 RepID=A0ABS4W8E2_9MICC|nr:DUF4286 family protein [Paeniglutamicibacter psychrophenolicus]MBP2372480.1 hypothetical protein [Paeniglutamicibacter psychrophenolicus]
MKEEPEYLWLVQLDIPEEFEDEFNRIYDTQHVPFIAQVPGVLGVQRYVLERSSTGMQRYATLYRVNSPELPQTPEWKAASARGDWAAKIKPHLANSALSMFRAMGQASAESLDHFSRQPKDTS